MIYTKTERELTEYCLKFIFNTGARCDGKTLVGPIIQQMINQVPDVERRSLHKGLDEIRFATMLLGDSEPAMMESLMEKPSNWRNFRLVAEAFASEAQHKLPVAVLQMAMPGEAMNHRVRQSFRRKECPTLAALCRKITLP